MTPPIAVVTACRNYGRFLPECLESVRAQTWTDWVHVVVDDASDDHSRDLAWEAGQRDSRVEPVPLRTHHGLAQCLNLAAAATRATWLLKLDADDTVEPTYLERIIAAAREDQHRNVIFSWCHEFGVLLDRVHRYPAFDPARMADVFMIPGPAAIRRDLWLAVGGLRDLACAEDWDFYVRAQAAVGLVPHQIPAPLWNYRQHDAPGRRTHEGQHMLPTYQAEWRELLKAAA
jgi:glycosyltransferase involved in cell wall biosynthesis